MHYKRINSRLKTEPNDRDKIRDDLSDKPAALAAWKIYGRTKSRSTCTSNNDISVHGARCVNFPLAK